MPGGRNRGNEIGFTGAFESFICHGGGEIFEDDSDKPKIIGFLNRTLHSMGVYSRRRDCHFADALSPSLLKHLLKVDGGAAE